jgi:hypothetical protein
VGALLSRSRKHLFEDGNTNITTLLRDTGSRDRASNHRRHPAIDVDRCAVDVTSRIGCEETHEPSELLASPMRPIGSLASMACCFMKASSGKVEPDARCRRTMRIGFSNAPFRRPSIYRQAGAASIALHCSRSRMKIPILRGWFGALLGLRGLIALLGGRLPEYRPSAIPGVCGKPVSVIEIKPLGTDRIDAPVCAAGRAWASPDGRGFSQSPAHPRWRRCSSRRRHSTGSVRCRYRKHA